METYHRPMAYHPMQQQFSAAPVQPVRDAHEPVGMPMKIVTFVVRALIGAAAIWAPVSLAMSHRSGWDIMAALSHGGTLALGIYFAILAILALVVPRRVDMPSPWLRMGMVVMSLTICLVYAFLMRGTYHNAPYLLEHLVVPIAVVVDWVFLGRNQRSVRWWNLLLGLLPLLAYFAYALSYQQRHGYALYSFIDYTEDNFLAMVGMVLAGVLVLEAILWGIAAVRNAITHAR